MKRTLLLFLVIMPWMISAADTPRKNRITEFLTKAFKKKPKSDKVALQEDDEVALQEDKDTPNEPAHSAEPAATGKKSRLGKTFTYTVDNIIEEEGPGRTDTSTLDLSNRGLTSLKGVENLNNLEEVMVLNLAFNELTSLKELSQVINKMKYLKQLFLMGNQLDNLEGLPDNMYHLEILMTDDDISEKEARRVAPDTGTRLERLNSSQLKNLK